MSEGFFLSVVTVVRNRAADLPRLAASLETIARGHSADYELIFVDNASLDESVDVFRELTGEGGVPNLQVYALSLPVDADTAQFVGMENAIGEYVAMVDPDQDSIDFLPTMIDAARAGADVVLAENTRKPRMGLVYRLAAALFHVLYRLVHRVNLARDAPRFRILSRRVIGYVLQHSAPNMVYRRVPATAGFVRTRLTYTSDFRPMNRKSFFDSFEIGVRQLVSSGAELFRLMSALCLFGAVANIVYSAYVLLTYISKKDVAPGWVTLSLQQSGMFFLISLVLLILGEYVLHIMVSSQKSPMYIVAQEMTSHVVTRRQRINVEGTP